MTVIAARKYPGRVEIACDSAVTWHDGTADGLVDISGDKIWKSDSIYFGGAGDGPVLSMFEAHTRKHSIKSLAMPDVHAWLDVFYRAVKRRSTDGKPDHSMELLMIAEGRIFTLDGYQILEHRKFAAIGSGTVPALVAMDMGANPGKAVAAACKRNAFCRPPIVRRRVKV